MKTEALNRGGSVLPRPETVNKKTSATPGEVILRKNVGFCQLPFPQSQFAAVHVTARIERDLCDVIADAALELGLTNGGALRLVVRHFQQNRAAIMPVLRGWLNMENEGGVQR